MGGDYGVSFNGGEYGVVLGGEDGGDVVFREVRQTRFFLVLS